MKKKRLLVLSILIPLLSIATVFAGLAGGDSFKNNVALNEHKAATQPIDTTKYWDESDEIKALIDAGKTENQWQGSGTADDPYLISSSLDLAWLSYRVYSGTGIFTINNSKKYFYKNKNFKIIKSLDVYKYWWQPIGLRYNR